MRTVMTSILCLGLLLSAGGKALSAPNRETNDLVDKLPQDVQVELALSALPQQLRSDATVYVLNPTTGFEVARKGTNGFYAFVARTGDDAMQGTWPLTEYPKDVLYPVSFDNAGAKANMQVFFDIAKMQAQGTPPGDLKKIIQERYRSGYYRAPDRAGCSYMLSPILRTYVNPDESNSIVTASVPHVMCYAPNVSTKEIGVTPTPDQLRDFSRYGHWRDTPNPFVIHSGPHGYMVHIRGATDQKAIINENKPLLKKLCDINPKWCLPASIDQR